MEWRLKIIYCMVIPAFFLFLFPFFVFSFDQPLRKKSIPAPENTVTGNKSSQDYSKLIQSVEVSDGNWETRDSFIRNYMKILTVRLTRTQPGLDYLRDKESLVPEESRFALYNGEIKSVKRIERAMFIASVWNAGAEIYKKTELSRKVRRIENRISKYFIMEYSKTVSEKKAEFYLPGELTQEERKEKKEYRVTMTSFVYPGEASLSPSLSTTLNILYFQTETSFKYAFDERAATIGFASLYLNLLTNTNTGVYVVRNKDESPLYVLKTSIDF